MRWLERGLIVCGLVLLLVPFWQWGYSSLAQAQLRWEVAHGVHRDGARPAASESAGVAAGGADARDNPTLGPSNGAFPSTGRGAAGVTAAEGGSGLEDASSAAGNATAQPPTPAQRSASEQTALRRDMAAHPSTDFAPPFIIRIPKVGVDAVVVNGVGVADLRRGPGLYPSSPLPGQTGNVAIAGHRTTYGAWFRHVDQLSAGDRIVLSNGSREITYKVQRLYVVLPTDVSPIQPSRQHILTLTTCTPPGTSAKRLIVRAVEVPPKSS